MNAAALAQRHSRAAALLAVALVIGGVLAALALPKHLSPASVPPHRHRHSLRTLPPQSMMLTVTRRIEEVVMSVPDPQCPFAEYPWCRRDLAQFDPSADMIVALQQVQNRVAEVTGDCRWTRKSRSSG
jgi:multidrug efflux pump subunit AcrB